MKSKSFDLRESLAVQSKSNKAFDFVALYKSAAETHLNLSDENSFSKIKADTPQQRERSSNKKKKKNKNEPVDISHIHIDGTNLNFSLGIGRSSPVNDSRTSTPHASGKSRNQVPIVKSIMKSSSNDDVMDRSDVDASVSKPKKRNKSVSFMLDDTEQVAIKKTKSNDSMQPDRKSVKANKLKDKHCKDDVKKIFKKLKKHLQAEKENKANDNVKTDKISLDNLNAAEKKSNIKAGKSKSLVPDATTDTLDSEGKIISQEKKKKLKKIKKQKMMEESSEPTENESNNNDDPTTERKVKKLKKKKRHAKSVQAEASEGEPATKTRRRETELTEDLENLSIGDNAHTLTNLLDEMSVVDKDKKKKNKHRRKKDNIQNASSVSSSETADLEKIEEGKEKVKWKKRKWNKDKKGDIDEENLITSVIVENLPLQIMINYKKLLSDHFGKLGLIKKIGIAEVYPTEEPKPVFTTTIFFYSDGSATKALEEDNKLFEGSRIRVKRPQAAPLTTLVVRSYADLGEQALSSVFSGAGRIRNIRHLVKGRKSMGTAFIEFDGPEAVEKAIKMAEDAKIGGKKIHVSRFELRGAKKQNKGRHHESENEGDSEDSND